MQTRYIAHITIQALTPLKVGSSNKDFMQDAPVQRDWNGLPMILGTSIAGVLRKEFDTAAAEEIFGKEKGSKVIFSNALLLDENNRVHEALLLEKSDFLKIFDNLPLREHTAITDKGVARDKSKFDEEVVFKGSRFRFSIEMLEDKEAFEQLLAYIQSPTFRLGGGTTKGFGKFKIETIETSTVDTLDKLENYSSSLNDFKGETVTVVPKAHPDYTTYTLRIKPDDFFMFGSGFGDEDADMTPVYEKVINAEYNGLTEKQILVPASSVKGALSHRTAYHYNRYLLERGEDHTKTGEENAAVKAVFGHKKEQDEANNELGQKGKILIGDCFQTDTAQTKVFDHVAIDRFTGGALDGALFQEKTVADNRTYELELLLRNDVEEEYRNAFELAIRDITTGMLPLGYGTTKGHGVFTGELLKNGELV